MSTRRSSRPTHGTAHASSDQSFDLNQMQRAITETTFDNNHSSSRSGDRHRQYTPPSSGSNSRQHSQRQHGGHHQLQEQHSNDIQVVSGSTIPGQSLPTVTESNGASHAATVSSSSSNPVKKEKYKSLWGKVGKHGMSQAAAARGDEGESSSPVSKVHSKKWDQVLNPLLQKSKQQDKKLAKRQSEAEISYHMQQQQQLQQQQNQISNATSGGSYVFSDTSVTGTVECDCGDDSCPNCNLLLQMSGSGW